jgi:cation:H+ antiporter
MLTTLTLLFVGLALLIGGAEVMVRGASAIALRFKISPLVVGLTVVAFGTSAPEFVVNILAAINGSADIGLGNIIGSNISNILLILGVASIISPLNIKRGTVWKEIPFALLAVVLIFIMGNDQIFNQTPNNIISRGEGLILISMLIIFMYYVFGQARHHNHDDDATITPYPAHVAIIFVLLGIGGLVFGGNLLVDQAVKLARSAGISEAMIGVTIIAFGTSLPELATAVTASIKRQTDIAVGNVVGSNIFNVFWIVGASASIQPASFSAILQFDLLIAIFASILLFATMFTGRRHVLHRSEGTIFVLLYVVYIGYVVVRG